MSRPHNSVKAHRTQAHFNGTVNLDD